MSDNKDNLKAPKNMEELKAYEKNLDSLKRSSNFTRDDIGEKELKIFGKDRLEGSSILAKKKALHEKLKSLVGERAEDYKIDKTLKAEGLGEKERRQLKGVIKEKIKKEPLILSSNERNRLRRKFLAKKRFNVLEGRRQAIEAGIEEDWGNLSGKRKNDFNSLGSQEFEKSETTSEKRESVGFAKNDNRAKTSAGQKPNSIVSGLGRKGKMGFGGVSDSGAKRSDLLNFK